MDDYISREAARKMLEMAHIVTDGEYSGYCTEDVNLDAIPTADVRPVIYAHWTTDHPDKRNKEWHCSNCKYEPQVFENSNFCPNCGAVMDGGRNNA